MSKLDDLLVDFGQSDELFWKKEDSEFIVLDEFKQPFKDLILEVFRGVHTYVPDDFQPKLEKVVNDL